MSGGAALLRFELAGARRSRAVPLFAIGFGVAALAIALVGLSAGGALAVQGFARTSVSLLQVVVWVVPLLSLLLGAAAGAECHELEFITALAFSRTRLVAARWGAWLIALSAALGAGLGAAGLAIAALAGAADGWRYLALAGVSTLLLSACLALGVWIGVAARTRPRALAVAIAVWFVLVVGVDLLAIGVLAMLPARPAGWGLSLLLLADPVDSARALGLGLFRADAIAGPTGAALRRVLGGWGAAALVAGLLAWTAVPLWLAGRRFARSDL
jgi:Cu-processing system permease protein